MPFAALDTAGVARAVAEIADQPDDLAEAFLERREDVEWSSSSDESTAASVRVRREEGVAVRLVRGERTWLASRDGLSGRSLADAVRQVARTQPRAILGEPQLEGGSWGETESVLETFSSFAGAVDRALRSLHVAFPLRLTLRRIRRDLQVVGPRLVPPTESEAFFAVTAQLPWGTHGELIEDLATRQVDRLASALAESFRCREAASPEPGSRTVVLAPAAAAVLLHEAVAHALEADTAMTSLVENGDIAAAIGETWGPAWLDVLDDPASAPALVRRQTDDEGVPVVRRWLLREGRVEQPLADALWARGSAQLQPGAARRGDRHNAPGPRSLFLEVPPTTGAVAAVDLRQDVAEGLWVPFLRRASLDPRSGLCTLEAPCARWVRHGELAGPAGACRFIAPLRELLGSLSAVGNDIEEGGAGWCAKSGHRVAVWARVPSLRWDRLETVGVL